MEWYAVPGELESATTVATGLYTDMWASYQPNALDPLGARLGMMGHGYATTSGVVLLVHRVTSTPKDVGTKSATAVAPPLLCSSVVLFGPFGLARSRETGAVVIPVYLAVKSFSEKPRVNGSVAVAAMISRKRPDSHVRSEQLKSVSAVRPQQSLLP
ncbi:hypothetical protein KPB2_5368 [Klebsiella pneumoniae Kb677]|nr:hypothetical protein KPB2_5368 [Klebsiella pneumoniae Kb677]